MTRLFIFGLLVEFVSLSVAQTTVGKTPESLTFVSPIECPHPFSVSGGICLLFNEKTTSWHEAEEFCVSMGGHLVWMSNRPEHNVVRGFARMKAHNSYFWIGLHRGGRYNNLIWSSGSKSKYRGSPLTDADEPFFAADSRDLQFDGDGDAMHAASVCRFSSQNSSFADPMNLLTILEHSRVEMEDMMIHMEGQIIKKINNYVQNIVVMTAAVLLDCPPPWIRTEGMCLLYIFQLRSRSDAEDLCTIHGGTLVWFENDKEHDFIRSLRWTNHKRIYKLFWIGLHREKAVGLIWSGMSVSDYRGSRLEGGVRANYFFASSESSEIYGARDNALISAVCRRQLRVRKDVQLNRQANIQDAFDL